MELCENETLNHIYKKRKTLTEYEVKYYLYQLLLAIIHLHRNRIVHRDLKLGNLFLSKNMTVKLGDFGLAVKLKSDDEKRFTVCGTPNYIAPEILNEDCGYQYSADVWSLGVILYVLIIGKPPFESINTDTLYQKIKCGLFRFPDDVKLTLEFKQLIRSVFTVDPAKRINAEEMLKSDFFMKSIIPKKLPSFTKLFSPDEDKMQEILLQGVVDMTQIARELSQLRREDLTNGEYKNKTGSPRTSRAGQSTQNGSNGTRVNSGHSANLNQNNFQKQPTHVDGNRVETEELKIDLFVVKLKKFGVAYKMNNDRHLGVFFNDKSQIVMDSKSMIFQFSEKVLKIPQQKPRDTLRISKGTTRPILTKRSEGLLHGTK